MLNVPSIAKNKEKKLEFETSFVPHLSLSRCIVFDSTIFWGRMKRKILIDSILRRWFVKCKWRQKRRAKLTRNRSINNFLTLLFDVYSQHTFSSPSLFIFSEFISTSINIEIIEHNSLTNEWRSGAKHCDSVYVAVH